MQALFLARQFLNTWQDAGSAYSYGLLSDRTFEVALLDMSVSLEEAPGLYPLFSYLREAYKLDDDSSPISNGWRAQRGQCGRWHHRRTQPRGTGDWQPPAPCANNR